MILELLGDLLFLIINGVLSLFMMIPSLPDGVISVVQEYIGFFTSSVNIIRFFIPVGFITTFVAAAFIIEHFEVLYRIIRYVLSLIPIIGIKND